MLPKVVVDDFGGKRTDPGMLGHGIYFAEAARYHTDMLSVLYYLKKIRMHLPFVCYSEEF